MLELSGCLCRSIAVGIQSKFSLIVAMPHPDVTIAIGPEFNHDLIRIRLRFDWNSISAAIMVEIRRDCGGFRRDRGRDIATVIRLDFDH